MAAKTHRESETPTILERVLERGEEAVSQVLHELLGGQSVADQLGRTVERAADAKRRVDDNMQTVLSLLNVPSRADYERLVKKIDKLQGSLVNLNVKVDRILAAQEEARASTPRPARVSKPRRPASGAASPPAAEIPIKTTPRNE